MQLERAAELENAWKARGNPACKHPNYEHEYYFGYVIGDVCTTCGTYLNAPEIKKHAAE